MMRAQRHGAGRWTMAAVVALMACVALGLSGCGDDAPAEPKATVVFTHQVSGASVGEIYLNGEKLINISEGEIAAARELSLGSVSAEFRLRDGNEGGLMQPTSVTLEDRTYLLAFVGDLGGGVTTSLKSFEAAALSTHTVGDGEHAFEVINLMTDGSSIKVFAGSTVVADNPPVFEETTFTNVAIDGAKINISATDNNANGAPVAGPVSVDVSSGGASMIILGGTTANMTIDALTL